jgi:hypothetical protein
MDGEARPAGAGSDLAFLLHERVPYVRGWAGAEKAADGLRNELVASGLAEGVAGVRAEVTVAGVGVVELGRVSPATAEVLAGLLAIARQASAETVGIQNRGENVSNLEPVRSDDDRVLAAITLAGQVVPFLSNPELLIRAVDDVVGEWRANISQRDEPSPQSPRPAGTSTSLVKFVDDYCAAVEDAETCPHDPACVDDSDCTARMWFAHVMKLATAESDNNSASNGRAAVGLAAPAP